MDLQHLYLIWHSIGFLHAQAYSSIFAFVTILTVVTKSRVIPQWHAFCCSITFLAVATVFAKSLLSPAKLLPKLLLMWPSSILSHLIVVIFSLALTTYLLYTLTKLF